MTLGAVTISTRLLPHPLSAGTVRTNARHWYGIPVLAAGVERISRRS